MAKKKDHLYVPLDLAKSVILGTSTRSACGIEKILTRADLEVTDYFDTCAACTTVVAGQQRGETISTLKKQGWTRLLEKVLLDLIQPRWVMHSYTWTSTAGTSAPAQGFPPAA